MLSALSYQTRRRLKLASSILAICIGFADSYALATKPPKSELKKKLTKIQYHVTQEEGTEQPFRNEYWDNKEPGIYVDVVGGEALFSSLDKYKSGTGWPSFTKPLEKANIVEKADDTFFVRRTEVRSKLSDSHLGHVFKDGPKPSGLRYCINSAALRFVPVSRLEKEGYGKYLNLFAQNKTAAVSRKQAKAIFAGGCFWCMEPPFEKLKGVKAVISGFAGGEKKNPSYREVAGGRTKHVEAVEITYDPSQISFEKLLDVYWMQIDPTDSGGQFVDRGAQYRPVIFYLSEDQKKAAEKSKQAIAASKRFKKKITVPILPATPFYKAEEYHQDYYKKSSYRYKFYRSRSGRDKFLQKYWKAGKRG